MPVGVRQTCEIKGYDGYDMYDRWFALIESFLYGNWISCPVSACLPFNRAIQELGGKLLL
jgi:hypothetical protein